MRQIHIEDKEWNDFKCALYTGKVSTGLFLVQGSSETIARQVQSTLQNADLCGNTFRYFLCSGSEQFRVPCYLSFAEGEIASEAIDPNYLLNRSSSSTTSLQEFVVRKLEQSIANDLSRPRFIVLEYMTPPGRSDLAFTSQLLHSPFSQRIPIVIFMHSYNRERCQPDGTVDEILMMLYLCGGRVRETDWHMMIDRFIGHSLNNGLIASRYIGSETWVCYAHRGVAEMAKDMYRTMGQERQHELAQRMLQAIPHDIGYPLLSIATATGEIEAMQSKYSRKVMDAALIEPENVICYFDRLRQMAQQTGDDTLATSAYTGYLIAHLYLDKTKVLQTYQRYQNVCLSQIDQSVEAAFWFGLGGNLALINLPEAWICAEDCLHRGRVLINNLYHVEKIEQNEWRFTLASMANTEALIAYKLGQGERAHQLEEWAIAELKQVPANPFFQVHVRINFGDLFMRMLGDVKSAMTQYEEAFQTSLRISKPLKRQLGLSGISRDELRAAQKLGDALMLLKRHEEALRMFEALLNHLRKPSGLRKEEIAVRVLKARLALAKAYLKVERPRSAIACYWHIFRQSAWLAPEALREVATELRMHRSELSDHQHKRIDGIIAAREEVMTDVLTIQNMLSSL